MATCCKYNKEDVAAKEAMEKCDSCNSFETGNSHLNVSWMVFHNSLPFQRVYLSRKRVITVGMTFKFNRVVIIWCSPELVRPDFVATIVSRFDKDVEIRDRWISDGLLSKKIWGGAVAMFCHEMSARLALRELRKQSRSIKTMMFSNFLELVVDTEIRHPSCVSSFTRIQIKANKSFTQKQIFHVEMILYSLGNVEFLHFHQDVVDYGVICEVDFSFTSQAVATMAIMDGMVYKPSGRISVEMVENSKEKEITDMIKMRLVQFLTKA